MPSSRALTIAALLAAATPARAQPPVQGFAVERFYAAAPEGGWFVMDALDMHGGLGGAMSLTMGYASNPLRITDGTTHLAVVSDQAFAGFGIAATYRRWRWYLNLDMPLAIYGQSGIVGAYSFAGPTVNLGSNPDTLSDARLGGDVRLVGGPTSRFRFGLSAQLIIPSGFRVDYDTDDTFRGMLRSLFAGDVGLFTYAAQLGLHIRPVDDATPGSPKGSELLFGAAAGVRLPIGPARAWAVVVGPELFGATAFRFFFNSGTTAFEGLLSGRIEGTRSDRLQFRIKLGVGGGLHQQFGAPEWRILAAIEVFNHRDGNRQAASAPRCAPDALAASLEICP
jgi:hypothetical protein